MKKVLKSICEIIHEWEEKCDTIERYIELGRLKEAKMIHDEYAAKHGGKKVWEVERAESELQAAELYYNMWISTKDEKYKEIAADELEHAEMILEDTIKFTPNEVNIFSNRIKELKAKLR